MNPSLTRSIAGGLAGTAVMTAMMYTVAPMMGIHMDIAEMLGSMLGGNWGAGLMMHVVNGAVIFPLVFATLVYKRLPGAPVARGTVWGVVLWLIAQAIVMPMMGAGFFSTAAGGAMAAMGSLVAHVLYGGVLGAVAGRPQPFTVAAIA